MFCGRCGAPVKAGQLFCLRCGGKLYDLASADGEGENEEASEVATPSDVAPRTPAPLPSEARPRSNALSPAVQVYAGFWRRAGGFIVDYFAIVLFYAMGFTVALGAGFTLGQREQTALSLSLLIIVPLYFAIFESSRLQATIGKIVFRIRVTDLKGQRPTFQRALVRGFSRLVSGLLFGVGFTIAAVTQRRQALHDKIAGTLVVRKSSTAREVEIAPPLARNTGFAGTFPVVGIVVFGPVVLGYALGIVVPEWQDRLIERQVAQGMLVADSYKAAVASAIAKGQALETLTNESLGLPKSVSDRFVKAVGVERGIIGLEYRGTTALSLEGRMLLLIPSLRANGQIEWSCGHAPVEGRSPIAAERLDKQTTIPEQQLPENCRAR